MSDPQVIFKPYYPIVAGQPIKLSDLISFNFSNSPEVASYSLRFDVYPTSGFTITGGTSFPIAGGGIQFEAHVYGAPSGYGAQSTEFSGLSVTFNSLANTSIPNIYDGIIYVGSNHEFAYDESYLVGTDTIRSSSSLFTDGNDSVDFNNLSPAQVAAIISGADLYDSLAGNDTITLPTSVSALELGTTGVAYNLGAYFNLGSGNDVVYVSAYNSHIGLGAGADTIDLGTAATTTLALGGGTATLNFQSTTSQTVILGALPTALVANMTIAGFVAGDVLDFANQPGLTLSAALGSIGEVDLYSGNIKVAALTFPGSISNLEPISDNAGGTEIVIGTNSLFTDSDDLVDFNNLSPTQVNAIIGGADLYDSLAGNDTITLPNSINALELGTTGVAYDLNTYFDLGDGNDVVYVSAYNSHIALGGGADTIDLGSAASTTLALGSGTATLNFQSTTSQTVILGTLPTALVANMTIAGFVAGDVLDFANQPGLTLSAAFGSAGEVDLYSGKTKVATLIFPGSTSNLEPISDNAGGTEIVVDTSNVGIIDPPGIDWSQIHSSEGFETAPYVPPGMYSGVTVGYGVDFGGGIINDDVLTQLFGNWQSNPNLVFLAKSIGDQGPDAVTDLNTSIVQQVNSQPYSEGISLTQSQANALSNYAEAAIYKDIVAAYNSATAANPGTGWDSLDNGAKACIVDMAYNFGLTKLMGYRFWQQVIDHDWVAADNELKGWGGPAQLLARRALDRKNLETIPQLQAAPLSAAPIQVPSTIPTPPADASNSENYQVAVNDTSATYAFDPTGSVFTLTEVVGSPGIGVITLPSTDAAAYSVSYEVGSNWSSPVAAAPGEALALPDGGANAIEVSLLDSSGNPLSGNTDFTFYLNFVTIGTVSATVTAGDASTTAPTNPLTGLIYTSADSGPYGNALLAVVSNGLTNNTLTSFQYVSGAAAPGPSSGASGVAAITATTTTPVAIPTTDSATVITTTSPTSITGGAAGQTVIAGNGAFTFTNITPSGNAVTYIAAGDGNNVIATTPGTSGNYAINTGTGNDTISVSGNAVVNAGTGTNLIAVTGGNALIYSEGYDSITGSAVAGGGMDTVNVGSGQATINPGTSNFVIYSTSAANTNPLIFDAGSGSDTISVGLGGGTVTGGSAGNNILYAGAGGPGGAPTTLFGTADGDQLYASGNTVAFVTAGAGNETISGAGGTPTGGVSVFGSAANNTFKAGSGNDTLIAGAGNDTLMGGTGHALMVSGTGADTFSFTFGTGGNDTITGFKATDTLQLTGYGITMVPASSVGAGTLISLSDGTTITLSSVTSLNPNQVVLN